MNKQDFINQAQKFSNDQYVKDNTLGRDRLKTKRNNIYDANGINEDLVTGVDSKVDAIADEIRTAWNTVFSKRLELAQYLRTRLEPKK